MNMSREVIADKGIWTANVLKSILNQDRDSEYYLYSDKKWKNELAVKL